ncbi:glycerophosphodiester phosphodiesterase [Haloarcula sp. S1CR25-12]|uniref:Glycerophosphodiester phosphodiesterase n=1 Tax=Haloarcula saliterrae TaxID=2950534 RepID=A0ABU2FBU1_9EURY|nr:glycerophosphodiester phosphodiesterase [Haloarcula sp. S1CR25-12]MDS0259739.1 glycerophosphodiester phosphodiesterase [Haloarcula sp. S1CR25-12]
MSPDIDRRSFVRGTGATLAGAGLDTTGAARGRSESASGKSDDADWTDVNVIAHRGFAGRYPENTVGAVEAASTGGASKRSVSPRAEMIEIDVLPTADGTVVVFHDDDLAGRDGGTRGLTDTSGIVWETDTETVTSATVLGTDETVPTLTEVLDAIPPSVGVNVEFKNPGSDDLEFATELSDDALAAQTDLWRPFTESVLDILGEYDNEILVSSFHEAAIATVREQDPSIPVAFLFWDDVRTGLDITRKYDCEALNVPRNMVQGTPFFDDESYADDVDIVEVAHEAGRELNTYTVTTWYQAQQLADAGVDGIIADYPGLLSFDG